VQASLRLSAAEVLQLASTGQLGKNAKLYAALRKAGVESEFRISMQNCYA
jgi:hypothetical protein